MQQLRHSNHGNCCKVVQYASDTLSVGICLDLGGCADLDSVYLFAGDRAGYFSFSVFAFSPRRCSRRFPLAITCPLRIRNFKNQEKYLSSDRACDDLGWCVYLGAIFLYEVSHPRASGCHELPALSFDWGAGRCAYAGNWLVG